MITSSGVLMPLLPHRFLVKFSNDMEFILTKQITKCSIDCIDQTVTINAIQPAEDSGVLFKISQLCQLSNATVDIEFFAGEHSKAATIIHLSGRMTSHSLSLDYGLTSEVATHIMVFQYSDAEYYIPDDKLYDEAEHSQCDHEENQDPDTATGTDSNE